ncbi:hypothetical protein D3C87_335060 [compost metagenome]
MKKFYSLLAVVALTANVIAQTFPLKETMGSVSGTTAIASNTFAYSGTWTYSGDADVRATSPSGTYAGASAGANVFITNSVGRYFQIDGINTSSVSTGNLRLTFGTLKSISAIPATDKRLKLEVSTNASDWTEISYTRVATNTGWELITIDSDIPSSTTLSLKFTQVGSGTGSAQYRVDDVTFIDKTTLAVIDATKGKANLVKNTIVANELIFGTVGKVSVVNMNGQVVKTAEVSENSRLDVSSLAKGAYVVTAVVNGQTVSQKIIKK